MEHLKYLDDHLPRALYRPEGRAGEYAEWACNPFAGCGHRCIYCYVPDYIRMTRPEFDAGAHEKANFREAIEREAAALQAAGLSVQAMLSFTSDPYHPFDTSLTRDCLITLVKYGHSFCPLSKGGNRALRDLSLFRPKRDAYAVTLTSISDSFARKYERKAAPPSERIATLQRFYEAGVWCWVSGEPILSAAQTLAMIASTYRFVDFYKLGGLSHLSLKQPVDKRDFTLRAVDLLDKLGASAYFKQDLQPFLPAGYQNAMRVEQHN